MRIPENRLPGRPKFGAPDRAKNRHPAPAKVIAMTVARLAIDP